MNDKEQYLLKISHLTSGYEKNPVLKDVNLIIKPKESVLLMGPNGSGKSALLKAIVGELKIWRADSSIQFLNYKWTKKKEPTTDFRINAGIGYLRQVQNIFTNLTVRENLELSLLPLKNIDKQEAIKNVLKIFPMLKEKLDKRAGLLSGGQRQAAAIAMVLIKPCSLYLLDEPTAGLSPVAAIEIMDCLKNFAKTHPQSSLLMVEHRLELLKWMNKAYLLREGQIAKEFASIKKALSESSLEEHYF